MKTSTLLALAAASGAQLVAAHTTVWNVVINGDKQPDGKGKYIDAPPNDSPVTDVNSKDMTCNVIADKATNPVEVKGGDKVGIEWHYESRDANDMIIDKSHMGPVMTYIAPAESGASGKGWVKIAEHGWADGKWGVRALIDNKGVHNVVVPDVPAGEYLLRPELIAMHEIGKPQFYMSCIHIKVTSSGSANLPEGISIPGDYKMSGPGLKYSIYPGSGNPEDGDHSDFKAPGGEVWSGAGGSGSGSGNSSPKPAQSGSSNDTPTTLATVTRPAATGKSEYDDEEEKEEGSGSGSGSGSGGDVAEDWEQCGGEGWKGPTKCNKGFKCKEENQWYFQCVQ